MMAMSAIGPKRTFGFALDMSANDPKPTFPFAYREQTIPAV